MEHIVKILDIENITHDVKRFLTEKPKNYTFEPGQSTTVSINREKWKNEKRPFTFTSINTNKELEFIIKIYTNHKGVTNELNKLSISDELIIGNPWGTLKYEGPGYFIAGGAGITPFIAIFRELFRKNKINGNTLFYSNKTEQDIILNTELKNMLGNQFINVITNEVSKKYINQYIDKSFLQSYVTDLTKKIYVCGPPPMRSALTNIFKDMGIISNSVIFES